MQSGPKHESRAVAAATAAHPSSQECAFTALFNTCALGTWRGRGTTHSVGTSTCGRCCEGGETPLKLPASSSHHRLSLSHQVRQGTCIILQCRFQALAHPRVIAVQPLQLLVVQKRWLHQLGPDRGTGDVLKSSSLPTGPALLCCRDDNQHVLNSAGGRARAVLDSRHWCLSPTQ